MPRKNVKSFFGRPVIQYGISTALASGLFQEVMVSTDDPEVAAIAEFCGAVVPFLRRPETANDHATTLDVLKEVLGVYSDKGIYFDRVCCLYPVAPLVSIDDLTGGLEAMDENNVECVFPVVEFGHPIHRAIEIKNGFGSYVRSGLVNERTQDIQPYYHDAGQWYWLDVDRMMSSKSIDEMKVRILPKPEWRVQDVDDVNDWVMLELKYRYINQWSDR